MFERITIASRFGPNEHAVIFPGDCREMLSQIPPETVQLVVTSPPYNLGKEYENKLHLAEYTAQQRQVIRDCVRVLKPNGSICWQVGNYVEAGAIIPLDSLLYPVFAEFGLRMRNRIVWHFEHGLHCSRRLSGRYEVILWFTKGDDYVFNLDPIRIPQKYPGKKYFKGPKAGQYSCNPLGKSPGDVWVIPNVKSNHVEKTRHPCQYPVELIERLVLALSRPGDWVLDPFLGTGTSIIAALRHNRRGVGAELVERYVQIARQRIQQAADGTLPVRPMDRPVFDPKDAGRALLTAPWLESENGHKQAVLLEKGSKYRARK
ncbi:MAG: site-specific DNA-methyltransferase [Verrucomicrobia bacterium]|nr:site-specific DNA-methyltransferase [Verrucomicrobiota bacterium]